MNNATVTTVFETTMNGDWNQQYINITQDVLFDVVQGLYIYAIPILSMLGMFGNLCSMKVFMLTYFRRYPSSIYLAALSLSDTWFLIALLAGWFGSLNEHLKTSGCSCLFVIYVTYVTSFLSVWYVVMIMMDRYIVVCHPLQKPKLCTKKRVAIATFLVAGFSLGFYSHIFVTMKVLDNTDGTVCTMHEDYLNVITVFTYIDTVITFVVPFVTITIMSVKVIFTIRRFSYKYISRYEKKYFLTPSNTLSKAQFRLTKMLIVVTCVFLILNLPSHAIRFYILVHDLLNEETSIKLVLTQQFCQIIYYANFAINFFLYVATSKSFRRCLLQPIVCTDLSGLYESVHRTRNISKLAFRNMELKHFKKRRLGRTHISKPDTIRFKSAIVSI